MSFKIQFFLSFFLFFFFFIADAFNITEILNKFPTYSTFNSYLTQTLVAGAINSRSTITVLAVSNDNIGSLSGKSGDDLIGIVSVHVVLDYFDMKKLQSMPNKTTVLTTLYQTTGKAKGQQGFLLVNVSSNGDVSFASDVAGGSNNLGAKLVGSVTSQPYNISVLQVSSVIIPPGIGSSVTNSTTATPPPSSSSPPSSTPPSPVPASSPRTSTTTTPSPTSSPKTSPTSSPLSPPAPTPTSTNASTPEPSNSTAPSTAPAPSTVDAPAPSTVDAPAPSTMSPTESPAADAAADNAPSLGTRLRFNLGAMSVAVMSTVCVMAMF